MMTLKLKETLPAELTKAPDVVIMNCSEAFDCDGLLSEVLSKGFPTL
jgi:hypothetical protein